MELTMNHIAKKFREQCAVDDVCLSLTPGVWGLLGANGAGKTTLMRMIAGILKPTSGEILLDGINIEVLGAAYRDIFGYLPQVFGFYPEFSVIDYLQYLAALKGLTRQHTKEKIEQMLEVMGLYEVRKKAIRKLSGGMQRRVGIAQALLNDPKILILDEPTSGLDPGERVYFRNILSEFAQTRIVLISTHIVSDVEYVASQNAIIKNGRIISIGKTEQLVSAVDGIVFEAEMTAREAELLTACVASVRNESADRVLVRYLSEQPLTTNSKSVPPRLEDLYLWTFRESTSGRRTFS